MSRFVLSLTQEAGMLAVSEVQLSAERAICSFDDLAALSARTRELILESVFIAGAGHLGGPLSATDLLVALYFDWLRIDPARPDLAERDRFILSKGHSAIGLYVVLALRGYYPVEELATFDEIDSRLQGHPDMTKLPGLDMSTGSLGQGLSPGVGMAIGAKMKRQAYRTWVMLGDGEIQEGQVWEAAFVASRYGLDNLTAILDANGLPQFGWPEATQPAHLSRTRPIDDPAAIFRAFGWHTVECDGHDHADIRRAFSAATDHQGQPTCVIAHTIKGKGVSFMEGDFNWHAKAPSREQLDAAISEIRAGLGRQEA
jgi:transketolase